MSESLRSLLGVAPEDAAGFVVVAFGVQGAGVEHGQGVVVRVEIKLAVERVEGVLWSVGFEQHIGQRGGGENAVGAASMQHLHGVCGFVEFAGTGERHRQFVDAGQALHRVGLAFAGAARVRPPPPASACRRNARAPLRA